MNFYKKYVIFVISIITLGFVYRNSNSANKRNVIVKFPVTSDLMLDPKCDGLCAENFYHSYVSRAETICPKSVRLGSGGEGGWDMCIVDNLLPRTPCLVYSFGIRKDWSFDDTMSTRYNCTVRAFDPSIDVATHKRNPNLWFYHEGVGAEDKVNEKNWTLSTIGSMRKRFNEIDTVIDYLKMDIEYNEWSVLNTALEDGSLIKVKQLGLEVHTREMELVPSRLEDYQIYVPLLLRLENLGFRRWKWHLNPQSTVAVSPYSNKKIMCCSEFIYYNVRYATLPDVVDAKA